MQWGRPGEMESRTKDERQTRLDQKRLVADVELTFSKPVRQPVGGISSVLEAKGQLQGCLESSRGRQDMRGSWQE